MDTYAEKFTTMTIWKFTKILGQRACKNSSNIIPFNIVVIDIRTYVYKKPMFVNSLNLGSLFIYQFPSLKVSKAWYGFFKSF